MSHDVREVAEGLQRQGVGESIIYTLDVTSSGSTPTNVAVTVFDEDDLDTDVQATVMPTNTPTVSGNVITLSPLTALTLNSVYRVEVQYDVGGSTLEPYFRVRAER
jgi:hypothetical protein